MSRPRYLYFIRKSDTSIFKIGIATDLKSRLFAIQTGNERKISYYKTFEFDTDSAERAEESLHLKFQTHRLEGEWFDFMPEALALAIKYAEELHASFTNKKSLPIEPEPEKPKPIFDKRWDKELAPKKKRKSAKDIPWHLPDGTLYFMSKEKKKKKNSQPTLSKQEQRWNRIYNKRFNTYWNDSSPPKRFDSPEY